MKNLLEIDKANIWHPFTPLQGTDEPILIKSASGVYLHTEDGRKIIDGVSSWWVNLHGHAHPEIADALALQARELEHVIFAGFTHRPAITLSQNLLKILPANQKKIFFSDNGSTAVEVALKMALQFWHNQSIQKETIIALQGAYHGDTFGSMSVGERGIFTDPFSRHLFKTEFIDFPEKGHEEKVFEQFKKLADTETVAAFIYEPLVQGASGMRIYEPSILDRIIGYAREKNILCIADEVFTGFGRTGKYFASDYLQNKPDIMALSKGLTGGTLPLGVTSCSHMILKAFETSDVLKTFFHGHSYTANPLACAAANKSFELLTSSVCQGNIDRISRQQEDFKKEIEKNPTIKSVNTLGTILAIELRSDEVSSYTHSSRKKIYTYFLEKNILLRPLGNIIYVLPPYVITHEQLTEVHNAIKDFLKLL
jgi:adenosylmethionine---8-amino-7-oxononanoate aminotransferase